jgi:hypothetical protein
MAVPDFHANNVDIVNFLNGQLVAAVSLDGAKSTKVGFGGTRVGNDQEDVYCKPHNAIAIIVIELPDSNHI